ncbi:unnamed protein product [Mesocestoides corti]|nr:unnamed protein product [Mesocestoides corti]
MDFAAQKMDLKILSKAEIVGVITPNERARRHALMEENKHSLSVLKRPKIDRSMTKAEISDAEQEAYLSWRRNLARLEQLDGIVITPYERNLEFWRQLWQVIERSDVLIQVIDARQPLLFFSTCLNDYIKEVDSRKTTLVLINKSDLLSHEQRRLWASYFNSIGTRVLFFSALNAQQQQASGALVEEQHLPQVPEKDEDEVKEKCEALTLAEMCEDFDDVSASDHSTLCDDSVDEDAEEASTDEKWSSCVADQVASSTSNSCKILSVDELVAELANSGTRREGCRYLTVGFLGYPNVGKSSTLNALCGAKKTSVSATPGKTKHFQTLFLRPDLQLCDCPGMVMPSFAYTQEDLVVAGILPVDKMHDCISPIRVICEQIPREVFSALYGITIRPPREHEDPNRPPTPHELLAAYACMRGFMAAKGNPHYDRAARIILKDYIKGRLRYCHPPPGVSASDFQALGVAEQGDAEVDPLSAYVAPTELHKLRQQRKRQNPASGVDSNKTSEKPFKDSDILTDFDRIALSSTQQKRSGAHPLVRSNKKLLAVVRDGDEFDDGASQFSTSSWSTVASTMSVGGASLLSGVSYTTNGSAMTSDLKKPWRQLSAIKKANREAGAKRKKEKLRRVYADLDRHEVE